MRQLIIITIASLTSSIAMAQTCYDNLPSTTINSRFVVLNSGSGTEILDKKTNLIWQRCSLGQSWNGQTCTGTANTYNWKNAMLAATNLGEGYRLANVKEIQSIMEYSCVLPAVNTRKFNGMVADGNYWTSTPFSADHGIKVWVRNGTVFSDRYTTKGFVMAVRNAP